MFRSILLVLVVALLGFVGWWGWMEMRAQDEGLEDRSLAELGRPTTSDRDRAAEPTSPVPGESQEGRGSVVAASDTSAVTGRDGVADGDEPGEGETSAGDVEPAAAEEGTAEPEVRETMPPPGDVDEPAGERQEVPSPASPPPELYAAVGGGWSLHPWSFADSTDAATAMQPLVREGMQPVVRRAEIDGQTWFRVLVGSFESRGDAWQTRATLSEMVDSDWVGVVRVR